MLDGSRDLLSCNGLWWEERDIVGCWTGLLPLLDHKSWSRLKLNSPLLSLWGLLRLPFSVPAKNDCIFYHAIRCHKILQDQNVTIFLI